MVSAARRGVRPPEREIGGYWSRSADHRDHRRGPAPLLIGLSRIVTDCCMDFLLGPLAYDSFLRSLMALVMVAAPVADAPVSGFSQIFRRGAVI